MSDAFQRQIDGMGDAEFVRCARSAAELSKKLADKLGDELPPDIQQLLDSTDEQIIAGRQRKRERMSEVQHYANARLMPGCVDHVGHDFALDVWGDSVESPVAVCKRCGLIRQDRVTTL